MPNLLTAALAALVPILLGFIWYHPNVFGKAWMKESGLTEESLKGANMIKILGISFLCCFFIAFSVNFFVIHQYGLYALLAGDPELYTVGSPAYLELKELLAKYGGNFRTFKHGALHGLIVGLLFVFPIIQVNALFERKSFKYVAINASFWILCLVIMGAIICAYGLDYPA